MENPGNDGSKQQMPRLQNYNLRSSSSSVVTVQEATAMASGLKREKFCGDGTDDIEEFKKFDRYVNVINAKKEQKWTFCAYIWKGVSVGS